jgi:hypothetical protein
MRCFAILSFILLATATQAQQALPAIKDPIFHLKIPAARYTAGFAETPQAILQVCGVKISATAQYRDWTLASAHDPSGTYLLLAGIERDSPAAAWSNDPNGAFVRVSGATCTAIDPADGVFAAIFAYTADPTLHIPSSVFTNLAANAATNYVHAYGNKTNFLAALKTQHDYPLPADEPLLAKAVSDSP